MIGRPFIFVLAGINGAGKSSIGGAMVREAGLAWFNPDSYARLLMRETGCSQEEANSVSWSFGRDKLVHAIQHGLNFAFESTLGAQTIPNLLKEAARTHDVKILFCGLNSVELHLERVALRVARGGHDIPEGKIRERWERSRANLVALLPYLKSLQVYDNSISVLPGQAIPQPVLVLDFDRSEVIHPSRTDAAALSLVPDWAKPIIQAAFELSDQRR